MKPGIDHVVLCVDDLDRASRFYERLGFTLTPRAQHPFGTANRLAQLQGSFLEILTVADRSLIPPTQPGRFSFGAFNEAYARRRQGMSMLVFPSEDARQDQRRFAASGLQTYEPFDFSRGAHLPDGSEVTVSFSLAFATHPEMPDAAFFSCQQHTPQYFWKPEYQRHANGAVAVVEILMAADAPHRLADFFAKLVNPQAVTMNGGGLRIDLSGGAITVLDREQHRARCPTDDSDTTIEGPRFVGFGVAVEDLARTEAILQTSNVPCRRIGDKLQIAPWDAFGATLEFSAAAQPSPHQQGISA